MKQYIKKILCVVIIAALSYSLCSCKYIDELRTQHGIYTSNKRDEISLNGNKYILMQTDILITSTTYKNINVTESNVPVLLSTEYGDYFDLSKNHKFITTYDNEIYCRSDIYEKYKEKPLESELKYYCIKTHEEYISNAFEDTELIVEHEKLNIKSSDAINDVLTTVSPIKKLNYKKRDTIPIYKTDKDTELKTDCIKLIITKNDKYYLSSDPENNKFYEIPEKYSSIFSKLINKAI